MGTSLSFNLTPIVIEDATVSVGIIPYESRLQLRSLRHAHRSTHFLRRDKNEIFCVPVVTDAPKITGSTRDVALQEHPYLYAALVREALVNFAFAIDRPSQFYDPIKISTDGNFLDGLVSGVTCPPWLMARLRYEVSTKVLGFGGDKLFPVLTLDVNTERVINISCDKLLSEGMNLDGLYVGTFAESEDQRMASRFKVMGCVRSLKGVELILDDIREGSSNLPSAQAYLEPNSAGFVRCLAHAFGGKVVNVKRALEMRLAAERQGPAKLKKFRAFIGRLSQRNIQIVPGVSLNLGSLLSQSSKSNFPAVNTAPKTIYVFNPSGSRTMEWNDGGLNAHGPYTSRNFTPSHPRICVICQKNRKGEVEQFLHKFREGIQVNNISKSVKTPPFSKGLIRKYALDGVSFEFFLTEDHKADSYWQAAQRAIQSAAQGNKWDLALVQTEEQFRSFYGDDNPYFVSKAAFLTQHVCTQAFKIETVRLPDSQLGYALNNMALATYAKLGGIPWLIKGDPTIAHEFVVGLGSANIGNQRFGEKERFVGITTVFRGDGNYFLSNVSQAVPLNKYRTTLLDSLRVTIKRIQSDLNWQPQDSVRLIFHAFKPLSGDEAGAVKELMAELGDFNVEYAFLHIQDNHSIVLFDEEQRGEKDYRSGALKGVGAPQRGLYFSMSPNETLITLTGPRELKRPEDGLPQPILMKLHYSSTFRDMTYLARQVYAFSCHSWRSFFPAPMPVTILYSDFVARKLGELSRLSRWNPDVMLGRIGTTRWFL